MKTVSFYRQDSGLFLGRTFTGDSDAIAANTPDGCLAMDGEHDHLSRRVDGGEVVDYQPPAPNADHEWNGVARRWVKRAAVIAAEIADQSARARIEAAEKVQLRAMRELLLNPEDVAARTKLQQIDQAIAAVRADIRQEIPE